ncbi:MAG: phytanoyl-CoA dioxygenase [Chitinophagaceae bacterium]|nr:MAG: phytanoyl-CoA dioxygenase [Chitinophagaceae bacterium]
MNLKQFKPVHWLYNLLHFKKLKHNNAAYKKYKLQKPLYASISSKDFPDKESRAWLDTGDSSELAPQKKAYQNFNPDLQQKILNWSKAGHICLDRFFTSELCDQVNAEIDQLMDSGRLQFTNGNKLMFAHKLSPLVENITKDERLVRLLEFLLDKKVIPFQTINFISGSGQRAHSDSIHMTTYPLGYLIAVWIALEDVHTDNGPLFYFPGSHRLPFLLNEGFNEGETFLTLGKKNYTDYEDVLESLVEKNGFSRQEFYARKGDVFIWHANLVHGGSPINNPSLTRKSMVIHYYADDVIKYHEITERPSLI